MPFKWWVKRLPAASGLAGYDLGKLLEGGYEYQVCTSRFFVGFRRRFFPKTLRYETRWQPKIDLRVTPTPLVNMIPRTRAHGTVHQFPSLTPEEEG